jgi:hypothetical protein
MTHAPMPICHVAFKNEFNAEYKYLVGRYISKFL